MKQWGLSEQVFYLELVAKPNPDRGLETRLLWGAVLYFSGPLSLSAQVILLAPELYEN
jgi:hypothetical protein